MKEQIYRLTQTQLNQALKGAIEMYVEFRDTHGQDDDQARLYGVGEVIDGLDADQELAASDPTERLRLQLPDAHAGLIQACERAATHMQQRDRLYDAEERELYDLLKAALEQAKARS